MIMNEIKFTNQILDNVHGFIPYTEAEKKIMDTLLFKRLQSIKQLSVVNWVFPGSEHTRFIHSLGVMHIADKIALSLNLSTKERKILRLAGLLHDIGHYPLSHVCEFPYRKQLASQDFPDDKFCNEINADVISNINGFTITPKTTLMSKSTGRHHESIGSLIIQHNSELRQILIDECEDNSAPEIISDIITGNVERSNIDPLLVQIIHSELDADGIDYLMRDATFSGTSFGSFEIDQLIRCLDIGIFNGKRILCITPKGIAAADQYLINKFFSYSQVVYNKHIVISEWMAEHVVNWMQKHSAIFPNGSTLEDWAKRSDETDQYLGFTDNLFWAALERILSNELSDLVPYYIKTFCSHLIHHNELVYVPDSEIRIISNSEKEIKDSLQKAAIIENEGTRDSHIAILSSRAMSSQTPYQEFIDAIKEKNKQAYDYKEGSLELQELISDAELSRLMECICIKESDKPLHLLCDDSRSLMRCLYNTNLVILRMYEFPTER